MIVHFFTKSCKIEKIVVILQPKTENLTNFYI